MKNKVLISFLLSFVLLLCSCGGTGGKNQTATVVNKIQAESYNIDSIPVFTDQPYVTVNDNNPDFKESDFSTESFEHYSELDYLGRCGVAYSNIGKDLMPTEKRGSIGSVKPTGWQIAKYDCVDGKYLYNRCHLIGYQLTAENANKSNLITGTRYLNVEGMLPFENMVADYIKETGNHVLYRVTPLFFGKNLVANGVQMEAKSVEDKGEGISFNVYCYNVQPGITINYATGESTLSEQSSGETSKGDSELEYVLNTNTKKFHYPGCSSVEQTKDKYKQNYTGKREDLIKQGYAPCGKCKP